MGRPARCTLSGHPGLPVLGRICGWVAGHERGDRVRCAVDVGAVVLAGPFALLPGPQGGAAVGPAGADQDRAGP